MPKKKKLQITLSFSSRNFMPLFLFILLGLLLSACSGGQGSPAAKAIESYHEALVAGDADRLANLSCANWEQDAQTELDSFAAVTVRLEDAACHEQGKDGESTLVSCTGKIIANYNGEDLEIDLADRTYVATYEAGEWRMCGYR